MPTVCGTRPSAVVERGILIHAIGLDITAIDNIEGYGIRTVPPSKTATAGIFCTYPQQFLTKASQFFSEFIASALLVIVIFALKDKSNTGGIRGDGNWFPLSLFFLIFGLGACFGYETG